MDTSQKIIQTSIQLFGENGYLGTSTKAIAEAAGVSEMTIFRKFKTKKDLFESMIKYSLGNQLIDQTTIDMNLDVHEFTKQVLHHRLTLVSKHIHLVQMIIRESLSGRLENDLNFIDKMSKKLHHLFEEYGKTNNKPDTMMIANLILSVVIKYAVVDYELEFDKLPRQKQSLYIKQCLAYTKKKKN